MRLMPELAQPLGKMAHALRGPPHQRLRLTAAISINQPLEILKQLTINLGQPLTPTTGPAHPPRLKPLPNPKLSDPLTDRRHRDPRRPRGRRDPTTPHRACLTRRPQPTLSLVQLTRQRPELLTNHNLIRHTVIVLRPRTTILQRYIPTGP